MKIAIVGLYPRDPDVIRGGVEAVTLRLSEGLAARPELDVHVVVSEAGRPLGTTQPASNLTVHSIGGSQRFGNLLFAFTDRRLIARHLRELQPDIVHAHSAHREALGAIESGLPTVVTVHGIIEAEIELERGARRRVSGFFRRHLVDETFRRMKNVLLLSTSVEQHYRERLRHARTWVIENPVHDRFFETARERRPDTILFSGVLIPRKGLPNLLEALALARQEVASARLRIAGQASDPVHEREIRDAVERLGLGDAVDFLGGLPPDELAAELAGASCLALVSRQETLPVAILESMAAGTPVVASPVGGIPEVVQDRENGFLVPFGEPATLAQRFVELLTDDDLRDRLGKNARLQAERRFTLAAVCARHLEVYREVLDEHRR